MTTRSSCDCPDQRWW